MKNASLQSANRWTDVDALPRLPQEPHLFLHSRAPRFFSNSNSHVWRSCYAVSIMQLCVKLDSPFLSTVRRHHFAVSSQIWLILEHYCGHRQEMVSSFSFLVEIIAMWLSFCILILLFNICSAVLAGTYSALTECKLCISSKNIRSAIF